MKIIFYILITISLVPYTFSQTTFQRTYTCSNAVFQSGSVTNGVYVEQTFDSGYFVAGTINVNMSDFFLMKVNNNGDTLWTKTFGGNFTELLYSAKQTSDSGFILAGVTNSFSQGATDGYLIKTDVSGNIIWSKNYGGFDNDWFESIDETDDGNFIACGSTYTYGAGAHDVYLVKISSNGNIIWTKTIGSPQYDSGRDVQQTVDKGFVITGYTNGFTAATSRIYVIKTDSTGSVIWTKIFGGVIGEDTKCIRQCFDGGYAISGYTNSYGAGATDIFLLKLDINGNFQWMKTYGGASEEIGNDIEQTSDSGFILTGRTYTFGGTERYVYMIKTNSSGDTLWTKAYQSSICNGYSVKQTYDGGYINASVPASLLLIKTDAFGNSGCNDISTNTIVSSVTPLQLSGYQTGSGGTAGTAGTLIRYIPITLDTLCISLIGVKEIYEPEAIIYPNPSLNLFTVELKNSHNDSRILLYNSQGILVSEQNSKYKKIVINRNGLASGLYFVEIIEDGKIIFNSRVFFID